MPSSLAASLAASSASGLASGLTSGMMTLGLEGAAVCPWGRPGWGWPDCACAEGSWQLGRAVGTWAGVSSEGSSRTVGEVRVGCSLAARGGALIPSGSMSATPRLALPAASSGGTLEPVAGGGRRECCHKAARSSAENGSRRGKKNGRASQQHQSRRQHAHGQQACNNTGTAGHLEVNIDMDGAQEHKCTSLSRRGPHRACEPR